MNQSYARVYAPYAMLTRAYAVQLYKNNALALLSRIFSILKSDWLQHARIVCGVYEGNFFWTDNYNFYTWAPLACFMCIPGWKGSIVICVHNVALISAIWRDDTSLYTKQQDTTTSYLKLLLQDKHLTSLLSLSWLS